MPPADLIPEVVRGIITYMNITNAAVLYDETFSEYISPPFGWENPLFGVVDHHVWWKILLSIFWVRRAAQSTV